MKTSNLIYALLLLLLTALPVTAEQAVGRDSSKVKFAYSVNFETYFDNREYKTALTNSMTVFAGRLTPAVGFVTRQDNGFSHRLMAGVDVMKDFGSGATGRQVLGELLLHYRMNKTVGRTEIDLTAGIFPRTFSKGGPYPELFISDSLRFYDNNIEGVMVSFRRPSSMYEIGCDWMGMMGPDTRERFMIFASGQAQLAKFLSIGYHAYMYHYACSWKVDGVVDNILADVSLGFDFTPYAPLQKLGVSVGYYQAAQNDRLNVGEYVLPYGFESVIDVEKWGVGLQHRCFVGKDMMPYYDSRDAGGYKYGSDLYFGDPFYRMFEPQSSAYRDAGKARAFGVYNKLELYYAPYIGRFLDLRISLIAHFHRRYTGFQQQFSLIFHL